MLSRRRFDARKQRTRLTTRSRSALSRLLYMVRLYYSEIFSGTMLTLAVLTSQCLDKNLGISTLEQAIKDIESSISEAGGSCVVKMAPKAVTENDDAELAALMEKRERENQEVSGDEDESSSDEGGVVEGEA